MFADRRTDPEAQRIASDFRDRFRDGPIGIWRSSMDYDKGLGFDGTGLFGNKIEFRPDGSGLLVSWGTGNDREKRFRWKTLGRCRLVIDAGDGESENGAGEVVEFDFFMMPRSEAVFMHGVGEDYFGEQDNFWCAVGPLVQVPEFDQVPVAGETHTVQGRSAILTWSDTTCIMTLGVGSCAIAGMLAELRGPVLPVWAAVAITLVPLVAFMFAHPGELPTKFVRISHIAASVWYLTVALGLMVALAWVGPLPRGWPLYSLFLLVGAIPCGAVLYQAARST